jgi:hypothetical protein
MGRVSMGALFASLDAFSAAAMTAEIDTDGDGLAPYADLQEIYPELNEELCREIDVYGDGYVNEDEWVAAIGTRLLAEPQDTL